MLAMPVCTTAMGTLDLPPLARVRRLQKSFKKFTCSLSFPFFQNIFNFNSNIITSFLSSPFSLQLPSSPPPHSWLFFFIIVIHACIHLLQSLLLLIGRTSLEGQESLTN